MPLLDSVVVVLIFAVATTPFLAMWNIMLLYDLLRIKEVVTPKPAASPAPLVDANDVVADDSGDRL